MSKRWHQEKRRDSWGRQARSKGYRARSAYKLKQIQERFGILRPGDAVLDIGCHPGGWTQVLVEEVGDDGFVVGVDLLATSKIKKKEILIGDITDPTTIERITEAIGGRDLNVVVSDISPGLTGRYDTDQAVSLELSTTALDTAMALISPGGSFVTKVFQGAGIEGLVDAAKQRFSSVGRFSPTASRSASSETYLVCLNRLSKPRGSAASTPALDQVRAHLASIGVVVEGEGEGEEGTKTGFRKLDRREG